MGDLEGFALLLQRDGSLKVVDAQVMSGPEGTQAVFVHGVPADELDGYLACGVKREGFDHRVMAAFLGEAIEAWKQKWAADEQRSNN